MLPKYCKLSTGKVELIRVSVLKGGAVLIARIVSVFGVDQDFMDPVGGAISEDCILQLQTGLSGRGTLG